MKNHNFVRTFAFWAMIALTAVLYHFGFIASPDWAMIGMIAVTLVVVIAVYALMRKTTRTNSFLLTVLTFAAGIAVAAPFIASLAVFGTIAWLPIISNVIYSITVVTVGIWMGRPMSASSWYGHWLRSKRAFMRGVTAMKDHNDPAAGDTGGTN